MTDPILCEFNDGIAIITLNRPDKLNAINYAMADAMLAVLDEIETNTTIGAVIITGAGGRAFSAGADIAEFSESVRQGAETAVRDFVRRGQTLTARLEAFGTPVIAAVNGLAYGGGCEITEAVHLSVAGQSATFAKPEIKLGMPPTFGGTPRLPRLAGRKRALEFLLTGDPFSAATALQAGLVNRVVPDGEVLPAAHALAKRIIRHSPPAVSGILAAVTRGLNMTIGEGLLAESDRFARLVPTHDLREGLDAWLERREARYSGH